VAAAGLAASGRARWGEGAAGGGNAAFEPHTRSAGGRLRGEKPTETHAGWAPTRSGRAPIGAAGAPPPDTQRCCRARCQPVPEISPLGGARGARAISPIKRLWVRASTEARPAPRATTAVHLVAGSTTSPACCRCTAPPGAAGGGAAAAEGATDAAPRRPRRRGCHHRAAPGATARAPPSRRRGRCGGGSTGWGGPPRQGARAGAGGERRRTRPGGAEDLRARRASPNSRTERVSNAAFYHHHRQQWSPAL